MHRRTTILAAALLASVPGSLLAATAPKSPPQAFTANVPAAGIDSVKLTFGVGDVSVTTGRTDTIRIKVSAEAGGPGGHFIFHWTTGPGTSGAAIPTDLHLVAERQGSELDVHLAGGTKDEGGPIVISPLGTTGGDHGWKGHWTLVLPARLALSLKGGVGSVKVSGLAGGLTAKMGVGSISAALANGPVDASVGVGKIAADVATAAYGDVTLTTGVGDVAFTVAGRKVSDGYEHHITSATQHASGTGSAAYRLEAGTGHVELNLGYKGPLQAGGDSTGDGAGDNR